MRRKTSLPLGIDIGSEYVSAVAAEAVDDGFAVREACTREVPVKDVLDLAIAETLRELLASFATRERRCILAAPAGEVVNRTFHLPPGMRRGEAERAATLEADTIVDWPAAERLVALDPIPGRAQERLLSIARLSTVQRLVAIAPRCGAAPGRRGRSGVRVAARASRDGRRPGLLDRTGRARRLRRSRRRRASLSTTAYRRPSGDERPGCFRRRETRRHRGRAEAYHPRLAVPLRIPRRTLTRRRLHADRR